MGLFKKKLSLYELSKMYGTDDIDFLKKKYDELYPKKKWFQKWWVWLIIVFTVISIGNTITRPGRIKDLKEAVNSVNMSDTSQALITLEKLYRENKIEYDDSEIGPIVSDIKNKMVLLGKDPDYVAPKVVPTEELLNKQLSAWDGSLPPLVNLVKEAMNDPDSFEHDKTLYLKSTKDSNEFVITMTYRGKNAFNAKVREQIKCLYNVQTKRISNIITK